MLNISGLVLFLLGVVIWHILQNKDSRTKMKEGPKAKEVKHWKKAFHLKVPNPPLPPQLSRGGGARKSAPTLPGVNMIVWSLDNRFVLAIMGTILRTSCLRKLPFSLTYACPNRNNGGRERGSILAVTLL